MAKLKIYKFPDLVLAQKAAPVSHIEKSLRKLADDMFETMYHAPGVGLAANQVGILQRIVVIDAEFEHEELPEGEPPKELPEGAEIVAGGIIKNKKPRILINPEIIHREGSILFSEGCLSVPEFSAEVKRAEKIKVQHQDLDGLTKTFSAEGLLAIVVQHELDHLDGKLFIDRLSPLKKETIRRRLKQERAEREAEERELGEAALVPKNKKATGL
ncbi:MAG: hypothetical protein A2428_10585 [Bdellovibrionales bacterium RIFOXYC1_FULL_54_43]|nr:MAG: hypothetical protein A2428_10585 [Bdellovibrionales bacterium RIFOXYC1_FULL_54_43]OFZ83587.1 MAG: hypothetical protein A2603_00435 [Bdellovibrionales bacterium RIFOXYD1_FULL_55_31]